MSGSDGEQEEDFEDGPEYRASFECHKCLYRDEWIVEQDGSQIPLGLKFFAIPFPCPICCQMATFSCEINEGAYKLL